MGDSAGPKGLAGGLEGAYLTAQLSYIEKNPLSKRGHDVACEYMPGGNTRTVLHVSPFPLTIKSGESAILTTVDGHQYIDFLGEYTAGIYGHNNPVIRKAIEQALDSGWNYGGHSDMERELARTVCTRFPAMELVRFVNSGTEANTMALASALAFTRKKKILMFYKSYHGGTISGKVDSSKPNINLPHHFVVTEYNDLGGVRALFDQQPDLKEDLAAILVEPMLGSGGCFAAQTDFLHLLRDLATQYNALLIFDEVMTSRLAYEGLGSAHKITPDMMTIGKWVGGGMTFGAFGGRKDIMRMYDPTAGQLDHPGTFNNNVFTMTAGIAGCDLLTEDRLRALNNLGDSMRVGLSQIFLKHGIEGQVPTSPLHEVENFPDPQSRPPKMFVVGVGSLMTIHFVGCDGAHLQGLYFHHMLENGIYLAQRGFIALSIEINQSHVDQFLQATEQFCRKWNTALRW